MSRKDPLDDAALRRFSDNMALRLKSHAHRSTASLPQAVVMLRLVAKVGELAEVTATGGGSQAAQRLCVDVANYAFLLCNDAD